MYGIATYIYHNQPKVGKYTIHWVSGILCTSDITRCGARNLSVSKSLY